MARRKGGLFAGMILGGAIGAVLGILYAPAKGDETREKLKKKTDKLKDDVAKKAGELKIEIEPVVQDIKEGIEDFAKQVTDGDTKAKSSQGAKSRVAKK